MHTFYWGLTSHPTPDTQSSAPSPERKPEQRTHGVAAHPQRSPPAVAVVEVGVVVVLVKAEEAEGRWLIGP